jgi:acetylornithine deacetylase/succinyl-diaminopimelate desuccinylase-like protein
MSWRYRPAVDVSISEVELLQALIRFDTSSPPGNEKACVEFAGGLLEQAGVDHEYFALEHARPNLVARVAGRGDAPPLLLYGHVDVVPADPPEWKHPPFGGELIDGEVWGRGALDMKGGVAILLSSLMRVASSDTPPPGDVILALTTDEEAGSRTGMKFLVQEHADLFHGVRHALSEFGGYTLWHGNRRFVPIQVAEKQRCLITATVRGPGGHASTLVRDPASKKLGELLSLIATRRLPVHVTATARLMLEAMAQELPRHEQLLLRSALAPRFARSLLAFSGAAGRMLTPLLCNTATPTVVSGGEATNVIPSELRVELDGRVLPGMTASDLLAELRALAGGLATFELVSEEPAVAIDPDLSLLPLLADIVRERDPGCFPIPMLLPGYTDARFVSKLGIQTYGFLPMRLPRHLDLSLVHAADERVPAEAIEFGVSCVVDVIDRYS